MYTTLYQPAWRLRAQMARSPVFRFSQELESNQWLSRTEIERVQLEKLQRLVEHAYSHIPFYRARFDEAGVRPHHIQRLSDITRLPILSPEDVRQHLDELLARNQTWPGLRLNATGGSTGRPVSFYQDLTYKTYNLASKLRYRRWYGFQRGDKVAFLWGMDRDLPESGWRKQLVLSLRRERWLNSFNVSAERLCAFARELAEWQPKVMIGYASSLHLFAAFVKERGLSGIRPQAIESSAEKLWAFQRELIESVFGCRVFNVYGSREFGGLAAECEQHRGLHTFSDLHVVEVIRRGQPALPGDLGEVVVTDLTNHAMPFIRYRIGDLARPAAAPCACGRGFPLLSEVVGRSSDVITTPDGRFVHGEYFTHLFYGLHGVQHFQVHQKALGDIDILVVSDDALPAQTVDDLGRRISQKVGPDVRLNFRRVGAIPLTRSGKYRFTISDVPLGLAAAEQVADV